jgi:hypothetical protein
VYPYRLVTFIVLVQPAPSWRYNTVGIGVGVPCPLCTRGRRQGGEEVSLIHRHDEEGMRRDRWDGASL